MALVHDCTEGWSLNGTHAGAPFAVEIVGPWQLPQVVDQRGGCALSGPQGAVFCGTPEQAQELADAANSGLLTTKNETGELA